MRSWVDGELQFGLFGIFCGEALHQQGCEPGSCSSAERVVHEEALVEKKKY
jgi:hypothetical protein